MRTSSNAEMDIRARNYMLRIAQLQNPTLYPRLIIISQNNNVLLVG